jgi:hypothetical protein
MSTKVFQGIRFPKNKLDQFVDHVRPAQLRQVEKHVRGIAERVGTSGPDYRARARKHRTWKKPEHKHSRDCWHCKTGVVMDMLREQTKSIDRNPYLDMGCGFNLWVPKGRFILGSPWGEPLVADVKMPEWVEKYGYWDSTDPLESVSTREWKRREKAWEGVLKHQWRKLVLTSFDSSSAYTVDMSWLILRLTRGKSWGDPGGR